MLNIILIEWLDLFIMKLILVSHSVWFENIILIRFKIRIIYIAKIAEFEVKDKIQVMKIR